jgi:hypothetical protein
MLSSLIVTISAMKRSALIMQYNLTVDSLARTSATRSAADKRTKHGVQQNNKTKLLLRFLLFSSYPSFLPTYLPTYLYHPFSLPACLSTYSPSFFPTNPLFYFGQSEPIVTSLLSLYVVLMPKYFYLLRSAFFPTYLPTYLLTYTTFFFFLPSHRFILARENQESRACFLCM